VRRGDRLVSLTQKEYALLEFLMRNAGRPLSRETISEQVWKHAFDPRTNIVDVYINYLRKKLESPSEPSMLQTLRGVGYVLKEPRSKS
jgi:DNA-binding response OmpR family regulator